MYVQPTVLSTSVCARFSRHISRLAPRQHCPLTTHEALVFSVLHCALRNAQPCRLVVCVERKAPQSPSLSELFTRQPPSRESTSWILACRRCMRRTQRPRSKYYLHHQLGFALAARPPVRCSKLSKCLHISMYDRILPGSRLSPRKLVQKDRHSLLPRFDLLGCTVVPPTLGRFSIVCLATLPARLYIRFLSALTSKLSSLWQKRAPPKKKNFFHIRHCIF